MQRFLFLAGIALMLAPDARGQWGPRGCPPQGPVGPVLRLPPARQWVAPAHDPGRWHLYVHGRLAGAYCTRAGLFRTCDAVAWHAPSAPPADLPVPVKPAAKPKGCGCATDCGCKASLCACAGDTRCADTCECERAELADEVPGLNDPANKGLCPDWLKNRGPEVLYLGAYKRELEPGVRDFGAVPDFAGKLRLVVVGSPAATARVKADAKTLPDTILVQAFRPTDWQVKGRDGEPAFRTDADPTLTLVTATGKVLHSQAGYNGVADLGALRKADPNYDPKKDPDLRNPAPLPIPLPANIPWTWVIAGGAVLLFILLRRKS